MNHKRTERLYRAEGLQVRTKRRRKLPRRDRVAAQVPLRPMQRWSLDFMSDQLADHRRFRILNIVDDHSRFCPGQIVDLSISGARVARYLDELARHFGLPEEIVLDNGPEGTSRAMFDWSERRGGPPAVHRAGQTGAERFRRKFQWQDARRMSEPPLVPIHPPRPRRNRRMAPPLQCQTATFSAPLAVTNGVPGYHHRVGA